MSTPTLSTIGNEEWISACFSPKNCRVNGSISTFWPVVHDGEVEVGCGRGDSRGPEELHVGAVLEDAVQVLGGPVVAVLVGHDDGHHVGALGERHREGSGVDDKLLLSDRRDKAGVFVLGDPHASSLAPSPETNTPRGYHCRMIADIKKRALHRSRILQGQLRGLEKMIDNEEYCVDIITQSLAVQKSLRSLNKLLVENHLRTHVTDMFEAGGDEREAAVAELLTVFELTNNRGQ